MPLTIASRPAEIVLIVRALRGAVGHDQRGLAGASGAPGALRVVGRGRRHVAHVDGVERRDVDAEFHSRRAEQGRQEDVGLADLAQLFLLLGELCAVLVAPAEPPFPPFPPVLIDLGGVLAAFDAEQGLAAARERVGERAVKLDEIGVRGAAVGASVRATRRTALAASRQPSTSKLVGTCRTSSILRGRSEQERSDDLGIGLAIEPLAPDAGRAKPAGEQAARAAAHDQRLAAHAGLGASSAHR